VSVPVLAFFNNKGGVGKTSLVYHLSWMLSEMGHRILACDLDPQANLTAAFLDEDALADLFDAPGEDATTVYKCVEPLTAVGDLRDPKLQRLSRNLALLPGDLALAGFEDFLSGEWPNSLGSANLYRPFRLLSGFWQIAQAGATQEDSDLILLDVGPNLGAINRSALIAADFVVVPLGADLFSLQGLRNLGPTLQRWRQDWRRRLENWVPSAFPLPSGVMSPIGYVVQQHGVRMSRPVKAYDRWANRIPAEYRRSVLAEPEPSSPLGTAQDSHCLATLKHYRSLVPMGQEAHKPIFGLSVADGAIGSHAQAVKDAHRDFHALAGRILKGVGLAVGR
jgi:chromosome partitioning protein